MICPKCGRPVEEQAVICRGCDFILDTDFLGGDILDEEHQLRPGQGGVDPAVFNLADAVILGNIGDDTSSFETSDSGFHLKKDLQAARLYVSGRSQAVMAPDAVIALINAGEKVRLTPFEKHVLRFIDGKRPVEAIRRQAGLDEAEVKTALANLADKGVIKVVGRALADAADFDVETAPGNAPRNKPRRVRGTLVGAVVVVGDAADQAIDDAFRTQVRAEAARPDLQVPDDADGGVFSMSEDEGSLPSAGSADVASYDGSGAAAREFAEGERGTDEIRARRRPTSSTSTVRPNAMRGAINAGGLTGRMAAPVLSDVDASDGFDDFGDASNLATAMVQQPSLSSESSLPGLDALDSMPAGVGDDVFSEPSLPPAPPTSSPLLGSGLSDLDDFDAPELDDLADSRVEPRPILPPLPSPETATPVAPMVPARAAPPAIPSLSEASAGLASDLGSASGLGPAHLSSEPSLNDEERAAFTGGVWDEASHPAGARRADGAKDAKDALNALGELELDDDDAPTAARAPYPQKRQRSELSTSLSQLLDADESASDEDTIQPPSPIAAPGRPRPAVAPARGQVVDRDGDGDDDEPTAFRPPPQAMPLVARRRSERGEAAGPPPISSEEAPLSREAWEDETSQPAHLRAHQDLPPSWDEETPQAPAAILPHRTADIDDVAAANARPSRGRHLADRPSDQISVQAASAAADRVGAADDLFPDEENEFDVSTEARPAPQLPAGGRPPPPPAAAPGTRGGRASLSDPDLTAPPSMVPEDDDSAWSSSRSARREQPPPPEPSRFESRFPSGAEESRGVPVGAPPAGPPTSLATEHLERPSSLPSLPADPPPPVGRGDDGDGDGISAFSNSGSLSNDLADDLSEERDDDRRGDRDGDGDSFQSARSSSRGHPTANIRKPPPSSSSEVVDSAMVIRPAIKAMPLALAARKARGRVDPPSASPSPGLTPGSRDLDADDGEFMVDPDATANLPALPKSQEGEARRRRRENSLVSEESLPGADDQPSIAEAPEKKPNRAPTIDMRRKARNLFEQAEKEHAAGRLGAARMNCKLATIYDPENEHYRRVLAAWEDRPVAGESSVSGLARPEYATLYEQAQDLEDDDDIDGALALLEKGLRIAPNAAAFHNRIGVILAMRKRDFERAADEIQKAIALDPENPHYRNNLGKVLAKANRRRGGDAVANAR